MSLSDSHDRSLKHLLAQGAQDFIRFALRSEKVQVIKAVELDLAARDLTCDGGYLIDRDGAAMVGHIEFLRRHQGRREVALDIGETQLRLCRREGLPVVSMAWDLYGSRRAPLVRRRV